jgi:hypothetical protein
LGTAYRPLTRLSLLLDARLFGWNAAPWHAVNLVLHVVNTGLVAVLARQAGFQPRDALLAGAVFAAVPLDWENVDWISGRTGLLCLGFMLAATVCWIRFQRFWWTASGLWSLAGACSCQTLALLCYEPAVVLPFALMTLVPVVGRSPRQRQRLMVAAAVLCGVVSVVWLLRWKLLGSGGLATDVAGSNYAATLATDMLSLGAHAFRDLGPIGFCGTVVLLACGVAARAYRWRVVCLLACCVVLYLPFTPVAGFTERFAYLATAPMAAGLIVSAMSRRGGRAALCLLAICFGIRSHAQATGFRHAGDVTRAMLARISAMPDDGKNLVFDGVPTHDGPYYLLWANFEDAVAARRPSSGFAATCEWVLRNPDLLRRALTGPTVFLVYDRQSGTFSPLPRDVWQQRHCLPGFPR